MILTGPRIHEEITTGRIVFDPYDPALLNPNSIDVHLGTRLLAYRDYELDTAKENPVVEVPFGPEGIVVTPDRLLLGHIDERVGSDHFVPIIKGKSSIARLGLFVHITADLVDQGAVGRWTLMLHAVQPLRVYPGMRIAQMTFWVPSGTPDLYTGKYQDARGPRPSESWREH